jgi:hypothetical protein
MHTHVNYSVKHNTSSCLPPRLAFACSSMHACANFRQHTRKCDCHPGISPASSLQEIIRQTSSMSQTLLSQELRKTLHKERDEKQHLQHEAQMLRDDVEALRRQLEAPCRSPASAIVTPVGHVHASWSRAYSPSCACCCDSSMIRGANCRHRECHDGMIEHISHAPACQTPQTSPSTCSPATTPTQSKSDACPRNDVRLLRICGGESACRHHHVVSCDEHHAGSSDVPHADTVSESMSSPSHREPSVCASPSAASYADGLASHSSTQLSASELCVSKCEGLEEGTHGDKHTLHLMHTQGTFECGDGPASVQQCATMPSSTGGQSTDAREAGKMCDDADACGDEAQKIVAHLARFLSTHSPLRPAMVAVSS